MEPIITIFGGSRCQAGDVEYEEARRAGQLLAEAGYTICTGGYLGVMEAASRGARERGGRVLGIVLNQFKSEPNRYLTDKVASAHFYERLQHLITRSQGFIAFRGGLGTVTEISLVWNKLQTRVIERRPLVLVGECWSPVLSAWQNHLVVSAEDTQLLDVVQGGAEAVQLILRKTARKV